jgi:hypothetical protein
MQITFASPDYLDIVHLYEYAYPQLRIADSDEPKDMEMKVKISS